MTIFYSVFFPKQFQLTLSQAVCCNNVEKADVTPVFKSSISIEVFKSSIYVEVFKSSIYVEVINYRHIFLLCIISKCMERCIY